MAEALMISEKDNVATSLADTSPGEEIIIRLGKQTNSIKALEQIPFGFKIALADITKGGPVIKYGESIGIASQGIKKGQMVHIHNIEGARGRGDLERGAAN